MAVKNIPKLIAGILLSLTLILGTMGLIVLMSYKSGGGLILLVPMYFLVRMVWVNMVLQRLPKVEPIKENKKDDAENSESLESEITPLPEIASLSIDKASNIENSKSVESVQKPNFMRRIYDFFTFQSPTFKSVFDEGQRRVITILSLVLPVVASYGFSYDFEDGYPSRVWYESIPIYYLAYFIVLLLYIWVREGQGKARPGGNAMKALGILLFSIASVIILIVGINYYYNEIYIVKINRDKREMVFRQFHQYLQDENIDLMSSILSPSVDNGNKEGLINDYKELFSNVDFLNSEVSEIIFPNEEEIQGIFRYTLDDKKRNKKTAVVKKVTMRFGWEYGEKYPVIEYLDINDLE